jgi:hypothetical protein
MVVVCYTWHADVVNFRNLLELQLDTSFARYVLKSMYLNDYGTLIKLYNNIQKACRDDDRHNTELLGQEKCFLFNYTTSKARSTAKATFDFVDAATNIRFRSVRNGSIRFAFTVQHVVSVVEHYATFTTTKALHLVHFCHIRNCCNRRHYYWATDVDNRSRDACRIRGYSFLSLRGPTRKILCMCPHAPCCLIYQRVTAVGFGRRRDMRRHISLRNPP